MQRKPKLVIFYCIFAILFLPMLQQQFPFVKSQELSGVAVAPDVSFTLDGWWDGTYMEGCNKYINDNIGFRPDLVRLNNQLNYSLFHVIRAGRVVEGKEHYLYMNIYTDSYFGRDYVGADSIRKRMLKLKAIQDTLGKLGKTILLLYTPSKEFMYPEYIPDSLVSKRTTTNFQTYRSIGDSLGINQLDINSYFFSQKGKSKEVLYSKMGIHWSTYGAYVAADTFVGTIENLRHIHMPHPVTTAMEHSISPRNSDADIAGNINLIWLPVNESLAYPTITYAKDATLTKPSTLYIGDSFMQVWMRLGLFDNIHSEWQLWYYFRDVYKWGMVTNQLDHYDWQHEVSTHDIIVISYTTSNLPELGDGFIEQLYGYYYPAK